MGFSVSELFGDAQTYVETAITDVKSTVVPAVIGGAEQWGATQLQQMSSVNQQAASAGVTQIMNAPGATSGIISSIENAVKNIATSTAYQNYGGYIVIGVIGLIFVGHFLGRK